MINIERTRKHTKRQGEKVCKNTKKTKKTAKELFGSKKLKILWKTFWNEMDRIFLYKNAGNFKIKDMICNFTIYTQAFIHVKKYFIYNGGIINLTESIGYVQDSKIDGQQFRLILLCPYVVNNMLKIHFWDCWCICGGCQKDRIQFKRLSC